MSADEAVVAAADAVAGPPPPPPYTADTDTSSGLTCWLCDRTTAAGPWALHRNEVWRPRVDSTLKLKSNQLPNTRPDR